MSLLAIPYVHLSKDAPWNPSLLGLIGQAEMEREIKRTVKQITQRNPSFEEQANLSLDFDEKALKTYLDFVTREISRKKKAL